MKALKFSALILVTFAISLASCKNEEAHMPNVIGALGEVLVIMEDHFREGPEGDSLMAILKQPIVALPQNEALFTVLTTPHRGFTGTMRTYRSIILVNLGPNAEDEGIKYFSTTPYAKDQSLIQINAKTSEKFFEILSQEEIRILSYLLRRERNRIYSSYKTIADASLSEMVKNQWEVNMLIPNTMRKAASTGKFTWLSYETPKLSQGMMIYSFDYIGEGTFSREYILNKRDSILRYNVPGPSDGSFMTTEKQLPVTYKRLTINGHEAIEMRGLWKVEGDLMGGPFLLFAHYDKTNNRVLVTDGYVYFPEEPKKRNYMWQLETLFHTVTFPGDNTEGK